MAYFTGYLQKKALNFALSQLGLFDQDAFDLDNQGISWGSTSIIELRDVPLSNQRLVELLSLPSYISISECRILSLRLTLPLNFVSNSVAIDIDGVRLRFSISSNEEAASSSKRKEATAGLARGVKANFPRTQDQFDDGHQGLPTTDYLAGSFLATQTIQERAEIKSAIERTRHESSREQDSNNTEDLGLGPDISLKAFFSNLAKGVLDRFKASIRDIQIEAAFRLPAATNSIIENSQNPEEVTFCLDIESIDIPPVCDELIQDGISQQADSSDRRTRKVSIEGIHGSLLSTSTLSSFMTQLSRPPSPALSRVTSKLSETANSPELSSGRSNPQRFSRSENASNAGSSSQSDSGLDGLERFKPSLSQSSYRSLRKLPAIPLSRSLLDEVEREIPASFGADSQALSDSEIFPLHSGSPALHRFGSDLENSALSESSESFLCKSPPQHDDIQQRIAASRSYSVASYSSTQRQPAERQDEQEVIPREDLTESKIFSAEEAKSIYMSAMSLGNDGNNIPGGWNESESEQSSPNSPRDVFHDATGITSERSPSPSVESVIQRPADSTQFPPQNSQRKTFSDSSDEDSPPPSLLVSNYNTEPATNSSSEKGAATSQNNPPEEQIPQSKGEEQPKDVPFMEQPSTIVKTLFIVDAVKIQIPSAAPAAVVTDPYHVTSQGSGDLPGAFSVHQPLDESVVNSVSCTDHVKTLPPKGLPEDDCKFVIDVANFIFCFDMASIRLLLLIHSSLPLYSAASKDSANSTSAPSIPAYSIQLHKGMFRFEETLPTHQRRSRRVRSDFIEEAFSTSSRDLIRFVLENLRIRSQQSKNEGHTDVLISKIYLGFPDENIISFNHGLKMRESVRDNLTPAGNDVSIKIVQIGSQSSQIDVNTAPLHLIINVNRLAEVINWLGGLSTVLDLGSSMKSTITVTETPNTSPKPKARGVHFEVGQPAVTTNQAGKAGPKVNLRIGGVACDITGKDASLSIEGSALKIVLRDGATRAQIDRINVFGPILSRQNADPALIISVDTLQIAYFDLPKENDLTRLLALLSPSQERDDQDDDILLDTLLRQRRKGAVLRIGISKVKARISQIQNFQHFSALIEELSQLSSVTKYLPEDDRPGLLILTALDEIQADIDINQNIKALSLSFNDTQLAIVTFPSLFLTSIGNINASHAGTELIVTATPDLRRSATRQPLSKEEPPKLSVKFIAGEMEPTVRIKTYNLRFEYHVTTLMAMLGISETSSGEVIIAEMVNTVANLATAETALGQSLLFEPRDPRTKDQKPFRVDIAIRDTLIALNPKGKPAQGLLVLSKSRITAVHAEEPGTNAQGSFSILKASFMVIDDKKSILKAEEVTDPNMISGLGTRPTQLQSLEAIGYVCVGQTSAATISARLVEAPTGNLLDVEVRDDLLVLETCADSTQTLLAVLGGLAPPMPPRKGNKYRTEVVPIQDMLASFSGNAFPTDAKAEDDTDYAAFSDDETGTIVLDEKEDSALDLDLNDEFYEPQTEPGDQSELSFGLSSVIFKDPVDIATSKGPVLSTFEEEAHAAASLHFDENHFGKDGDSRAKEWNSYKNTYDAANPSKVEGSPLRIHLKDLHFIWNLYDGYDWQKTRDTISQAVHDIEVKAEERRAARRDKLRAIEDEEPETVIGDMLFNSIYIGISAKDDPRDLSRRVNGILNDDSSETGSYATTTTVSAASSGAGSPRIRKKRLRLARSKNHKMTFELKGISGDIISYPPDSGETQCSIDARVHDLEIFDNVPTSTWRKFATYMHDAGDRQMGSSILHLEMLIVKPDQDLLASEFVLKIGILPLRLHVDQDALDFLTRFFEFKDEAAESPGTVADVPFIQRAEVGPVQIKLDFKPKRVDWRALRSGRTSEFMNFVILDEADMILRRIILYGVRGFDKLGHSLNDIWTPDVRTNQLPGVLAGLAPVRPLVNVGLGVRDLVVVPMREYKKDGRLVRAVRKGVLSFGKTTTTELAKLGAKLAVGTHTMLSNAEGLLSPDARRPLNTETGFDALPSDEQPTLSPYADQPIGVVQGLRGAYRGLERDLLLARDAIVAMPGEVMESQTASGAAVALMRSAPVVILRPAMGITRAVGQTLMGATNSLDKTERRRIEDKYKHR